MRGVRPPRAAIQRRICDGYIEYSIWVASGLVTARPLAPKSQAAWNSEIGVRGDADLVAGNRAEDDGAGRGAEAVDDDGFARSTQALIFVDVSSDPPPAIVGNPDHGLRRPHARKQENRREQPRYQPHSPAPVGSVEAESGRLRDARLPLGSFETWILSRQRRPLKTNSNQVLRRRCTRPAKGPKLEHDNESLRCAAATGKRDLALTAHNDAVLN